MGVILLLLLQRVSYKTVLWPTSTSNIDLNAEHHCSLAGFPFISQLSKIKKPVEGKAKRASFHRCSKSPPPSISFRFTSPLPRANGCLCPAPSFHPIIYINLNVAGIPSLPSSPCSSLYIASQANKTSLDIGPASRRRIALLSPIACKSVIKANVFGYSTTISSTSTVSSLKPAFPSNPPTSRTSAKGEICGLTPPRRSRSASCKDVRSSKSVSPPNIAAMKGLSGFKIWFICVRREGRSFIQWMEREERIASKVLGPKGRDSKVGTTWRVIFSRELNGRSSSRYRRDGDSSMHVSVEIRLPTVVCGDNTAASEAFCSCACLFSSLGSCSGGGIGCVSAFAILQLFAPRSKTFGNWRLISSNRSLRRNATSSLR
ncbi:Arp2/3 complex [Histoplasma capsulatum G186AR]|uniref:Arp2/3 complex n=1 Tax=Ajellomyces capsulatus TaxID=5037 RepID=A0A8H8D278_AJECA|nr:Arp2/3 complex [Histoplasma capsulatum]QSS68384.1 Arp2/3 complex [Histoplasma capsulatum G186AR]